MRFRTQLFFASGFVVLLLWVGSLWPIQRLIGSNLDHIAALNFTAARHGLRSLEDQHVTLLRHVGGMVMQIPELRALIAEDNFEISRDNRASLQERLDNLTHVMNVRFICVLDARGAIISQNSDSPWATLPKLHDYVVHSSQAQLLIENLYARPASRSSMSEGQYGLWLYQGNLYQVVGLPLVFGSDQQKQNVEGSLIIAEPMTTDLARELAESHNCQVSFLTADGGTISSLPSDLRAELRTQYNRKQWKSAATFQVALGGTIYRSYLEPLIDPCSGDTIGVTVIQSDMAETGLLQHKVFLSLMAIMSAGLVVAAVASFALSAAITRPIRYLVEGVKRVADGDLHSVIPLRRRDEIGELAAAFNDMVAKLRARLELERLVEESQAASKSKSQFLANMSHEIRTPLHGVSGISTLLLATDLNAAQRHYVQLIRSSTEVLTTLINDVLDFSKVEAGKLELEIAPFDLRSVIEDSVELLYEKASSKSLELACDFREELPSQISGDAVRLRQILMNLISNAVKFTERGQIIVRIRCERIEAGKATLRFEVSDSGIGIPPDRIGRLFKSFSQVDASTTRKYGGTGLGLAICKELVELMSGAIGVDSVSGQGSCFWFTAQFDEPHVQSLMPVAEFVGVPVLVAEANPLVRGILCRQLEELGVQPCEASTAAGAEGRLDVRCMFISRNIPHFFEALQLARERGVEPILLTGSDGGSAKDGCRFVITKPVRTAQLQRVLRSVLMGSEAAEFSRASQTSRLRASRRARILVAEDNEINRIVAAEFLAESGLEADLVNDGQSAVAAFKGSQYDLVLMDCQMPVMDGFEATRQIRTHEDKTRGKTVPIIALTANSSGADRQRCLDAGMSAYCGKPFRKEELLQTMAALMPNVFIDESSSIQRAPDVAQVLDPIQTVTALRVDELLDRCSGNANLAAAILEKFEKQASEAIEQIGKALRERDGASLSRLSHAMKGTAGVIAAEPLRLAVAEMERIGRENKMDEGDAIFERLREELSRCLTCIPQTRAGIENATAEKLRSPCKC